MQLTGVHLLLTYKCIYECDHCFVWGSPWQEGTMTLRHIEDILRQGQEHGTVRWIYFEGGEPFLYYPVLLRGIQMAAGMGFQVGLVTNGYWATSIDDATEWLRPFVGLVQDLSISSDLYHYDEKLSQQARNVSSAAARLGMSIGVLAIAQPEETIVAKSSGQLPEGESAVMYRGRAIEKLVPKAMSRSWSLYTECPYEDLRDPQRVHIDPLGYAHICQGISLGNLFRTSLNEICESYEPDSHPVIGPLLRGGPAELARHYSLSLSENYADACHLCYEARLLLRARFPDALGPDQMYGEMNL